MWTGAIGAGVPEAKIVEAIACPLHGTPIELSTHVVDASILGGPLCRAHEALCHGIKGPNSPWSTNTLRGAWWKGSVNCRGGLLRHMNGWFGGACMWPPLACRDRKGALRGAKGMDTLGLSGDRCSCLYPPTIYASLVANISVRLVAFLHRTRVNKSVGWRTGELAPENV